MSLWICLAKAYVIGMPMIMPMAIDVVGERTGQPIQDVMSEAKKTFTAAAPAPKG